jgi:hypothetical protein
LICFANSDIFRRPNKQFTFAIGVKHLFTITYFPLAIYEFSTIEFDLNRHFPLNVNC